MAGKAFSYLPGAWRLGGTKMGKRGPSPRSQPSSKHTNLMRQVQWANSKRTCQKRFPNINGHSTIKQDSHCGTLLLSLPCTRENLTQGTYTFSQSPRERTGPPKLPETTGKTFGVHVPIGVFPGKEPRDIHTKSRFILPSHSQAHAKLSEYTMII